jgi:hypothetical protein
VGSEAREEERAADQREERGAGERAPEVGHRLWTAPAAG